MRTKQGYDGKDVVTIQEAEIISVMMGDDEVVVEKRRWSCVQTIEMHVGNELG